MEKFRSCLDKIFWVVAITGVIALIIALIGGAIPINMNPSNQVVKFDLAFIGWVPNDPANGTLSITHEKEDIESGWGSLQFDYKVVSGHRPAFHCDNMVIESINTLTFYMKSKKPSVWAVQIRRKSDDKILSKMFRVDTKWTKIFITIDDLKARSGIKGKFNLNDFKKWIQFVDVNPRYDENTVWLDHFSIVRW